LNTKGAVQRRLKGWPPLGGVRKNSGLVFGTVLIVGRPKVVVWGGHVSQEIK